MHILLIPSWYPNELNSMDMGGVFFKDLAEAYSSQGHKMVVLAHLLPFPLNPKKLKGYLKRKPFWMNNNVLYYNIKFLNFSGYLHIDDRSAIISVVRWFRLYVKKNGMPDIIHAHSVFIAGIIAKNLSKKYGIPYCITEHGSWFLTGKTDRYHEVRSVFNNANCFTAVSSSLYNRLVQDYNLDTKKGKVVANLLNETFLRKGENSDPKSNFVFLNIALDSENKRRDLLINAFAEAFSDEPGVELWIGGTENENSSIFELSKNLKIQSRLKILGLLDKYHVKQYLVGCNVFVLSSDVETFGVVLIEALSQGKPVISTDSGGPKDIINKGNGLLVPIDDVHALANAMRFMRYNYTCYDLDFIRNECIQKYNPEIIIKEYVSHFNEYFPADKVTN